jgi:uncharacterized membrane protein
VLGALLVSVMAPGDGALPDSPALVVAAVAFLAAGRFGLLGTVVAGMVTVVALAGVS